MTVSSRMRAEAERRALLRAEARRQRDRRDDRQEAAEEHHQAVGDVPAGWLGAGFGLSLKPVGHPRPSKAEPLFAEAEENWYTISENPCAPGLLSALIPQLVAANRPVGPRIMIGWTSSAIIASFISRAPTFLPRYSGVRPTIWPAMKTPTIRKSSMLIMPTPLPPKMQFSHMPTSATRPASGLRLSCSQLTAPQVTSTVMRREGGAGRGAEAQLLAFQIAEMLVDRQARDRRDLTSRLPPGAVALGIS